MSNEVFTAGELIEELKKLPSQAEVYFGDVCGEYECELYSVEIDAERGIVLLIGEKKCQKPI